MEKVLTQQEMVDFKAELIAMRNSYAKTQPEVSISWKELSTKVEQDNWVKEVKAIKVVKPTAKEKKDELKAWAAILLKWAEK